MTAGEKIIINDLAQGCFRVSLHARIRMAERLVSDNDIISVGQTATFITPQGNGKHKIDGFDVDGCRLEVICAWVGDTLVITVF